MARYKVEWSPFASQCLSEIYFYISNREKSEVPADKFIRKVIERTDLLATHPYIGQAEPYFEARKKERRYLSDVFHTKLNPDKLNERDAED